MDGMDELENIRRDVKENIRLYTNPFTFTPIHAFTWLQSVNHPSVTMEFLDTAKVLASRALIAFEHGESNAPEHFAREMSRFFAILHRTARKRERELLTGE